MLIKKNFFFFIILWTFTNAFALTCPTVEDIKQGQFHHWIALYIDGEEGALPHDVMQFRQSITHFEAAKWDRKYLENAHCFYAGDHPIMRGIILAHDAFRPTENSVWTWIIPKQL